MFNVTITYENGYKLHYYNLKSKFVASLVSNLSGQDVFIAVVPV